MSKRVYVYDFLDVNGDYKQVESEKDLTEVEWQIKENQHNIEKLKEKCIAYDFLIKEADAKEDALIKKGG